MRVIGVERGSSADLVGVQAGDELVRVGGRPIADSLDLMVALGWTDGDTVSYTFRRGRRSIDVELPASAPADLGLDLEQDRTRTCGNNCVFCFVDQLPARLRPSLYVKDEDYRLSFTFGNYITLTNMTESDYARVERVRLSPLYVSVHATEDSVRRRLLGNADAPPILPALRRLGKAGIRVHAQIVLVPGVNDAEVLERSMDDLFGLRETVESVAVVPVGLTSHRSGLAPLRGVTAKDASQALDAIERAQERYMRAGSESNVYAADEMYLIAGRALPEYDSYDAFPQIENGVGLLRSFERELETDAQKLGPKLEHDLSVVLVTGILAAGFMERTIARTLGGIGGLRVSVRAVANDLFGPDVTVAGLLPGRDMARAISQEQGADLVLLPAAAFNQDGLTIDGMTAAEIAETAGRAAGQVVLTDNIVEAILSSSRAGGATT
jgi:putative radical SAM enzyme (TIGR03279 family)